MAGGNDLNLLKSWNPKLSKNRAKVKHKEDELLLEEKKIQEQIRERKLQDLATTKSKSGLEWMYHSIDGKFKNQETTQLKKNRQINESETLIPNTNDPVPHPNPDHNSTRRSNPQKYEKDDPMSKFKVAKKKRITKR